MGLNVSVYRDNQGDFTLNGISANVKSLTLMNVSGPSEPSELSPAALLVKGNAPGYVKIVTAVMHPGSDKWVERDGWSMMGGNYASTSDSRFHDAVRRITGGGSYGAVPIHDRYEG